MSEYVDFHYMPLDGKITGKQVLKQTEDAINDLGEKVYSIDIDSDLIQQAIDDSQTALDTAEEALSVVTTDRAIWYNNVGELIQSNAEAGVTIATKGYYIPNDGGNGFYIVRNKQSADVDDGGSIIFMDSGRVAELIVTDEVNINQFGGVGDGTTDDNTAIVNAVAFASAKNYRLVFLEGRTYYTSLGIVIANPPKEIRMDGTLKYTGGGTALTIGKASAYCSNIVVKLNVAGSHTANSNGVVLYNFSQSKIYLYVIKDFGDIAVEYCGDTKGFAYNSTIIGYLLSTPILLKLTNTTGGWCNENKFFGGRFAVNTTDSFADDAIGILITSENAYHNNGNIFYSPSLELKNGVKIEYGDDNAFYDCRTELSVNPFETSENAYYNYMRSSYGAFEKSVWDNTNIGVAANLYTDRGGFLFNQLTEDLFSASCINDNVAGDGSKFSAGKVVCCFQGAVRTYIDNWTGEITNGKLNIKSGYSSLGTVISTEKNKSFAISLSASSGCRILVFMWDSNGSLIANATVYSMALLATNREKLAYQASSSGASKYGYISGADATFTKRFITVPKECVKAFIGVTKGSASSFSLKDMKIRTKYIDSVHTYQNKETAVLDSIPTSEGKVGQFVKKTTPTVDCIGWVYDGTNWLSVGEKGTWLENVASLRSANLPVGIVVSTKGYYSANDGGNGTYNIRAATSDVDDGGSIIILDNGNVAELITDGTVCPEQFGAKGDGTTDDLAFIQKAVNFGKTVIFSKTYMISAGILLHSNLNIVGNNKGKIVKDPATTTHFPALYWFDTVNALENVTIKGLSIEGLKHWTGQTTSGNNNDVGIRIHFSKNVIIADCTVTECGAFAIGCSGENIVIDNNIVGYTGSFTGSPPNYNFGITYSATDMVISNNTISGVIQGIISGLTNKRVRIVSNDISTNGQHGLYMEGGDNVVVANNNIHDVSIAGVKFQKQDTSVFGDIVIDGNTIVNCGGQGVFVVDLSSATNSIERISITNNVIDKCVRCIEVQKVQQVDIVNNVLYATTTNGYGIRALTIDFANIVGNTIKTGNVLAIICSSDTTGTQINRSVLIAHNNIYITSSAVVGSVFGIEVSICNGMMVDGNIVTHDGTNTSMDGIYIHGASISKAYLTNNVVSGFRWDLRGVNLAEGAVTLGTNYYTTKTGL